MKQHQHKNPDGSVVTIWCGNGATIGTRARIGNGTRIGRGVMIGIGAWIGNDVRIGNDTRIGRGATIGYWATIENRARIGDWATICDWAWIGGQVTIGYGSVIGVRARIKTPLHYADGGLRRDGYRFSGYIHNGGIWITAGCRSFSIADAREHWASSSYRKRLLGDESLAIVNHIERLLRLRGFS